MTESANNWTRSRIRTALRIQTCALQLTDERGGVDGFTMDELAEAADVSRRTLFNYFGTKIDAICGFAPAVPEELLDRFRRGLPTGDLMCDLEQLLVDVVEHMAELIGVEEIDPDSAEIQCARRVQRENPVVLQRTQQHFEELVEQLGEVALERPDNQIDPNHVRMAVEVMVTICKVALEDFVSRESGEFAAHVRRAMDAVRSLYVT